MSDDGPVLCMCTPLPLALAQHQPDCAYAEQQQVMTPPVASTDEGDEPEPSDDDDEDQPGSDLILRSDPGGGGSSVVPTDTAFDAEGWERTSPGYMERSVMADIDALGSNAVRGRSSYVAIARMLARVLDGHGDDVGVTAMAKAADSLRGIMDILSRPRGDESSDVLGQLVARLSAPVRHTEDPGSTDAGPTGGADRG